MYDIICISLWPPEAMSLKGMLTVSSDFDGGLVLAARSFCLFCCVAYVVWLVYVYMYLLCMCVVCVSYCCLCMLI